MLIRHIPHSSTNIPTQYREHFLIDEDELNGEVLRLTDWYTEELFADSDSEEVRFPISRIVCDPERFLDDEHEPASQVGMGVFYTHGTQGQVVRSPDDDLRRKIIEEFYLPHHSKLTTKVNEFLKTSERAFVLDCHSFPTNPLPTDDHLDRSRPDFCLGFDDFHAPYEVIQECESLLLSKGFTVSINSPYAGCLIPMEFYGTDPRVKGMMIEVNRDVYMNEKTGKKRDQFGWIHEVVRSCILDPVKTYLQKS